MSKTKFSVAVAAALAALASAPPAFADVTAPQSAWQIFQYCPYNNPDVASCLYAVVNSGSFTIGSTSLPITQPITLQAGVVNLGPSPLYDAVGAPTLSAPPAQVPGGLLGIVNPAPSWPGPLWTAFWAIVGSANNVTATMELLPGSSANLVNALYPPTDGSNPTALQLNVRVHLQNPFLGNTCYIGSTASPITINLQTGTTSPPAPNKPISGNPGNSYYVWTDEANYVGYIQDDGNTLVDNAFSVPGANGCGNIALGLPILTPVLEALVNGAVNLKVGLPSAAGKNTAVMNGNSSIGAAFYVAANVN